MEQKLQELAELRFDTGVVPETPPSGTLREQANREKLVGHCDDDCNCANCFCGECGHCSPHC